MGTTPNSAGSFHEGAPIPQEVILYGTDGKPYNASGGGGGGGAITAAASSIAAAALVDGASVTQGATTDTAATSDTGTFSLIAFFKRLQQKIPVIGPQAKAASLSVTFATDNPKAGVTAASGDFADGAINTLGAQADAAVVGDTSGTANAHLRGLTKILNDIWDSTNHLFHFNLKQVGGNAIATGNNAVPILNTASAGAVAAYGSNAAATTGGSDYQFKWGAGGTTQVNHVMLANNTGANVSWDDSAATTAGSDVLATGQKLFLDVQTANFHVQTSGNQNVGGSSSNNIVIKGWL